MRRPFLLLVALALSAVACNREKAVAIQTMVGQLVDASAQIEEGLKTYWSVYHIPTGAIQEEDQYLNFASMLIGEREEILNPDYDEEIWPSESGLNGRKGMGYP